MSVILFKSFNRGNLVNQANPGSDSIIVGCHNAASRTKDVEMTKVYDALPAHLAR